MGVISQDREALGRQYLVLQRRVQKLYAILQDSKTAFDDYHKLEGVDLLMDDVVINPVIQTTIEGLREQVEELKRQEEVGKSQLHKLNKQIKKLEHLRKMDQQRIERLHNREDSLERALIAVSRLREDTKKALKDGLTFEDSIGRFRVKLTDKGVTFTSVEPKSENFHGY